MMAAAEVATVAAGVAMTDVHVPMAVVRGVTRVRVMKRVVMVRVNRADIGRDEQHGVDTRRADVSSTTVSAVWAAYPHRRAEHEKEREESARKHE